MVWWGYIIVWVVSFVVPMFVIVQDYDKKLDDEINITTETKNFYHGNLWMLSFIFATLNCIFFAILLGLE